MVYDSPSFCHAIFRISTMNSVLVEDGVQLLGRLLRRMSEEEPRRQQASRTRPGTKRAPRVS